MNNTKSSLVCLFSYRQMDDLGFPLTARVYTTAVFGLCTLRQPKLAERAIEMWRDSVKDVGPVHVSAHQALTAAYGYHGDLSSLLDVHHTIQSTVQTAEDYGSSIKRICSHLSSRHDAHMPSPVCLCCCSFCKTVSSLHLLYVSNLYFLLTFLWGCFCVDLYV